MTKVVANSLQSPFTSPDQEWCFAGSLQFHQEFQGTIDSEGKQWVITLKDRVEQAKIWWLYALLIMIF